MRLLAALLAASILTGCAPSEEEASFLAKRELLRRQNQGIRELIEEEEKGSLVPTGRFLIGVDETIVGGCFAPSFRSSARSASGSSSASRAPRCSCATSSAPSRSRASSTALGHRIAGPPCASSAASERWRSIPRGRQLRVSIAIDHIELLQAGSWRGSSAAEARSSSPRREPAPPGRPASARDAGRARALDPRSRDPGRRAPARFARVPLHLSVERVIAAQGKLWVTLHAEVGAVTGAEKGLGVAVGKKSRKRPGT